MNFEKIRAVDQVKKPESISHPSIMQSLIMIAVLLMMYGKNAEAQNVDVFLNNEPATESHEGSEDFNKETEDRINNFLNSKELSGEELLQEIEQIDTSEFTEEERAEYDKFLDSIKEDIAEKERLEQECLDKIKKYNYLPEEFVDYVDMDPMGILKSESELGDENSDFRDRAIGDPTDVYDRVLLTRRIVELHSDGKISPDGKINLSRTYKDNTDIENAVNRLLRYLGQQNFDDLNLGEKLELEQRTIKDLLRE